MTRDEEVIAMVRCPKCKARKGDPCTYVTGKSRWEWRSDIGHRGGYVEVVVHRIGEETKRAHIERHHLAWHPKRKPEPIEATPRAVVAWREWERREDEALREWLRENAMILILPDWDWRQVAKDVVPERFPRSTHGFGLTAPDST